MLMDFAVFGVRDDRLKSPFWVCVGRRVCRSESCKLSPNARLISGKGGNPLVLQAYEHAVSAYRIDNVSCTRSHHLRPLRFLANPISPSIAQDVSFIQLRSSFRDGEERVLVRAEAEAEPNVFWRLHRSRVTPPSAA